MITFLMWHIPYTNQGAGFQHCAGCRLEGLLCPSSRRLGRRCIWDKLPCGQDWLQLDLVSCGHMPSKSFNGKTLKSRLSRSEMHERLIKLCLFELMASSRVGTAADIRYVEVPTRKRPSAAIVFKHHISSASESLMQQNLAFSSVRACKFIRFSRQQS